MDNRITYKGIIQFDPDNKTIKHESQASWKKIAMVMLDGEICEYYNWFIETRYGLKLNKPLRNAHISFINDSINDIKKGCSIVSDKEAHQIWNSLKEKWNNKEIEVVLDLDPRSDSQHWWFNIPQDERELLHNIRKEVGLGRPFFGLHMSIGYVNEKNKLQSDYILDLLTKYGRDFY